VLPLPRGGGPGGDGWGIGEVIVKKRVYLAGPYSTGDKEANVRRAVEAADVLWAAGFSVFLPHLTHFWDLLSPTRMRTGLPTTWNGWPAVITWCDSPGSLPAPTGRKPWPGSGGFPYTTG
jgi:hypothetical protein